MYRFFIICILAGISLIHARAQSLYLPRDIKGAFKKQTRSMDGRPGKNYWQNYGRYDIHMTVMPPSRTVQGTEKIMYVNNSPDTLSTPVIKLILNIHKPGALRYRDASPNYLTSGIHVDTFLVNGAVVKWNEPLFHSTWQAFALPKPLLPHDSVELSFNWHYDLSVKSGREGLIDSTTFFLAYFYPRVAVYDDYMGWDRMEFTDSQEFYNDFNDYSLTVTVPKNYLVWATGTLQNPSEVLQPEYIQRLDRSMQSDTTLQIASFKELLSKQVTTQQPVNTWKWTATNISDVTVAISDHYVWDAASVIVDTVTGRRASVQAAYNETAHDFHYMVGFGRHALNWLSTNWPGTPYPFPKTTVVQGFADMEYPMMVNDGSNPDTSFSRLVVEHEIAHSWFPFHMGINETRYGFMDEGWATTFEFLIQREDRGEEKAEGLFKLFRVNRWINDNNAEEDLPIITPGNILNGPGMGNNEYGKAALGYLALKDLLGDRGFKRCLHAFIDRWHEKHPVPWDFFNTCNDVSGKDLNWFWNSWFFSNGYIDLGIEKVTKIKGDYIVALANIGGFPAPVDVVIHYRDAGTETLHVSPAAWKNNIKQTSITLPSKKEIESIELKGGIFMDADQTNNIWKAK